MYHIWYGFSYSTENSKKLSQRTNFLAFFQRLFNHCLLRPMSYAPIFCQMKCLMKIHNHDKFHLYSICGCQVINFPIFSWWCSIHEMAFLGVFLDPNCPKYCLILLKFAPEVVFKARKTVFQKFLKNSNFYENLTPFYSMKEAKIEKTK